MAAAKKNTGEEMFPAEELKNKYDTTDVIYSGVAAKNGWKSGRMVSESEYVKAVSDFLQAPLGRR